MNMRDKMRSLDTNIKADFIQKNQAESSVPNSATSSTFDSAGRRGRKDDRSAPSQTRDKSLRSLSRARSPFRGATSPKKHQKSSSASSFKRPKSVDLSRPYMTPTASNSSTSLHAKNQTDTSADPADFIHYLREVQKPELVEVGKLHKLRILLRNETVAWVDSFIAGDGMDEIIQLLYRIMKVEWRYVPLDRYFCLFTYAVQGGTRGQPTPRSFTLSQSTLYNLCCPATLDSLEQGVVPSTVRNDL